MFCWLKASGSWDKTVRLWNPAKGRCLFVLEGHGGWVQAIAFSADSIHLISAGDHDVLRIWDCTEGSCVQTLDVSAVFCASVKVLSFISGSIRSLSYLCIVWGNAPSTVGNETFYEVWRVTLRCTMGVATIVVWLCCNGVSLFLTCDGYRPWFSCREGGHVTCTGRGKVEDLACVDRHRRNAYPCFCLTLTAAATAILTILVITNSKNVQNFYFKWLCETFSSQSF